ncbi:MAG: formyltetrahydrofolate deformylase [Planctomycetota bacterium]|nr:MAG: formyltetrahydrofolate deformylase [Planctomycetota bacterium]
MQNSAILLITCPDQKGIINAITNFIFNNDGNIIDLEQHVDNSINMFFMRVEWELENFQISKEKFDETFQVNIAESYQMDWKIFYSSSTPKMALFVSQHQHCFYEVMSEYQSNSWKVDIPLVISNHLTLKGFTESLNIPFHHFEINNDNKKEQENLQLQLLKSHQIDFIVLARYMQILSKDFTTQYPNNIINIHHSFLPAFPGAKPYHSAFERGVKIIGATSHYVSEELDGGPIIDHDISYVSHNDNIQSLIRKGKNIEKLVLSRAIWKHLSRKVLVFKNKTVVFE